MKEVSPLASVSPANFKAAMRPLHRPSLSSPAAATAYSTHDRNRCVQRIGGARHNPDRGQSGEPSHGLIERSGAYTVNVLSASQQSLRPFRIELDRAICHRSTFAGTQQMPIIDNCASYLECVVESRIRSGTHSVFIGRVSHRAKATACR